jgi:hypothetical protein
LRPRQPTFCWSSPLIFTFSSNYNYVMLNAYIYICFCYSIYSKESRANNLFCEGFHGLIETTEATSTSTVSMSSLNPLPRSYWNRQIQIFFRGRVPLKVICIDNCKEQAAVLFLAEGYHDNIRHVIIYAVMKYSKYSIVHYNYFDFMNILCWNPWSCETEVNLGLACIET